MSLHNLQFTFREAISSSRILYYWDGLIQCDVTDTPKISEWSWATPVTPRYCKWSLLSGFKTKITCTPPLVDHLSYMSSPSFPRQIQSPDETQCCTKLQIFPRSFQLEIARSSHFIAESCCIFTIYLIYSLITDAVTGKGVEPYDD